MRGFSTTGAKGRSSQDDRVGADKQEDSGKKDNEEAVNKTPRAAYAKQNRKEDKKVEDGVEVTLAVGANSGKKRAQSETRKVDTTQNPESWTDAASSDDDGERKEDKEADGKRRRVRIASNEKGADGSTTVPEFGRAPSNVSGRVASRGRSVSLTPGQWTPRTPGTPSLRLEELDNLEMDDADP